jgi:hypothetical protein
VSQVRVVSFAGLLRRCGGRVGFGLGDFDGEGVAGAEDVGGEEDELFVGAEADVGFERVVLLRHVDEVTCLHEAGLDEAGLVDFGWDGAFVWFEEFDPLAVFGFGDLGIVAAVAAKDLVVG